MPRITRRLQARRDLKAIWHYIAKDNPEAADAMLYRIGRIFTKLADFPQIGQNCEELAPGLLSFPIGHYLIFYLEISDGINGFPEAIT